MGCKAIAIHSVRDSCRKIFNPKTYRFMKYLIAFFILLKSAIFRKNLYKIHFIKVKGLWYCDIHNWPKEFLDNAQMVAGAARLLELVSKGRDEVTAEVAFKEKFLKGYTGKARKTGSNLTGGAFYDVLYPIFTREMWICPVTLFVLGKFVSA